VRPSVRRGPQNIFFTFVVPILERFAHRSPVVLYWIENSGQNSHDQNLAPRIFPNLVKSAKKIFRAECDCAHEKVPKHSLARSAIVYAHSVFFKNSYNSKIYYNFRRYLTNYNLTESIFVLG